MSVKEGEKDGIMGAVVLPYDFRTRRPLSPTMKDDVLPNLGVGDVVGGVDEAGWGMDVEMIPTP
jgi:hypothetical protein